MPTAGTHITLIGRAARCCIVITAILLGVTGARSEYRYISGDPVATHATIVRDIQTQQVDPRNLDPRVMQAIFQGMFMGSPRADIVYRLGPVDQICMPFAVQFPNGRKLIFRTVHRNGCGDWHVVVSANPEIVLGLTMFPLPRVGQSQECGGGNGAPPVVLPIEPTGPETMVLPPRIDCTNANASPRRAPQAELQSVCQQWPLMCR